VSTNGAPNPEQNNDNAGQMANEIHWVHRATFFTKIGLGLIGLAALYFYYGQRNTMIDQLGQMQASGKQTDRLLGLYAQQLGEEKKLADTNRDALIAVQRAFVFPDASGQVEGWVDFSSPGHPTVFMLPFENSGATPTKTLYMHMNSESVRGEFPNNFFRDVLVNGKMIKDTQSMLGPHAKGAKLNVIISQQQMNDTFKGRTKFRAWGWAKYRDVFEGTPLHLTEFCFDVRFYGKPESESPDRVIFDHCPTRNCVDDQCEDYKKYK